MSRSSFKRTKYEMKDKPLEEQPKQDRVEPDECFICRGRYKQKSMLDACNHPACFECLKIWLGNSMTCAACRTPPKRHIIINPGRSLETTYPLSEIILEKEQKEREQYGNRAPLIGERAIIKKRKADLQRQINRLNQIEANQTHYNFQYGAANYDSITTTQQYTVLVTKLTSLNLLMNENIRKNVVSSPEFRELIFDQNIEWYSASPRYYPSRSHGYSSQQVRARSIQERNRVLPFIRNQLDYVQYSCRSKLSSKRLDSFAEDIFGKMMSVRINDPAFALWLITDLLMSRGSVDRFCDELFHFCATGLAMEEFYEISCYKFKRSTVQDVTLQQEVVLLDDDAIDLRERVLNIINSRINNINAQRGTEVIEIAEESDEEEVQVVYQTVSHNSRRRMRSYN